MDGEVAARLAARPLARKLGSGHDLAMRRLTLLVAVSLLATCAPRVQQPAPPVTRPTERPSGALIGLTAAELAQKFGVPALQVREGPGIKLQWSKNGCVIDAFLYPPDSGRGPERVTFADARRPSGADISVEACLAFLGP